MIALLVAAALLQAPNYPIKADSRVIFRPLDDMGEVGKRIDVACHGQMVLGNNQTQADGRASEQLGRRPKVADWDRVAVELSCLRADGFAKGRLAAGGYLMPAGASLGAGAIALADSVLADQPTNVVAARLLAILGPAVTNVDSIALIPARLGQMRGELAGPTANQLYRAVRSGVRDSVVFRGCVSLLLAAADYPTARDCGRRALAAGADSSWHLLRLAYIAFHTADTLAGAQLFRDAIAVARDSASRAELGWHLNVRARTAGLMDSPIPFTVLPLMSDSVADAWLALSDSSARVTWVRDRFAAMQRAAHEPVGALLRQHFYSVTYAWDTFWGCNQGFSYLVAAYRPSGQKVYQRGLTDPLPPCFPTYAPDVHPIKVTAARYRLWSAASAESVTLVAYAVALSSMVPSDDDRGSAIHYTLDFRERDAATSRWSDSAASSRLSTGGARQGFVQGIIALPRAEAASDWTLGVNQDITRRGILDENPSPLDRGPLELSDVVIGDPAQHLIWMLGQDSIVLAPLGAVDRHSTLELFVQLRSASAEPRLRTTVRVFRIRDGKPGGKAVIQLATTGAARSGITAIHRELDVNRLGSGVFQLQVEVANATARVTRTTVLEVR